MKVSKIFSLLILITLIIPQFLQGQADTLVYIETIEVTASKIREQTIGGQSTTWDSKTLNTTSGDNLAEMLESEGGVFIKSYGLNSLATSSIRGGSAGHTLVLWNGLPIQSPMLGLVDLSLLPLNSAEQITFQKGGSTALWGSGAIGGVIGLNNQADFNNKLTLGTQVKIGSFGELSTQLNFGFGNHWFQSSTKLSMHQADNDFYYSVGDGLPKRQQTNAHFHQKNLLQDFYFNFKNNQKLVVHYWLQYADRGIPPTNSQNNSEAHQDDRSSRLVIDWQLFRKASLLQAKAGYFEERQIYYDDAINLEANNNFTTLFAELEGQWLWNNRHRIYLGSTQSYTQAKSASYINPPKEYKTALFASYQFDRSNWQLQSSFRQELVDGKFIPLVPVIGMNYRLNKNLQLKGKISKNYRLPTLNDRYWNPGGNENLLPESGWSEEVTMQTRLGYGRSDFEFSVTGFNRKISNWILWSKKENQTFWSANNIAEVWSRGLEQRFSYSFKKENFRLKFLIAYDYIRSTNQIALTSPRLDKGSQLIYTPVHQGFAKLSLSWQQWRFSYQHHFTGASQGINDELPAYQFANARLQFDLDRNNYSGNLFFNINNIWNSEYLVIERRPMPGVHFQLGFNFLFSKKTKK
jgi:outer membrane cobalamin receptor